MTAPILLTGGTGTLGRRMVPLLREAGLKVRVLSRHAGEPADGVEYVTGDLMSGPAGAGVAAAVAGVDTIVHCAGSARGDDVKARTLVRAATGQVGHLVYISVVGADRVTVASRVDRAMFGYFEGKLAGERIIAESGISWTTLRATQFHDLIFDTVQRLARLPVVPVPSGLRFQPVDTGEVAARMVELALGEPAGLVPDLAGPRVYGLGELVRGYLKAAHRRRPLLPVRLPGRGARAVRAGATLPLDGDTGHRSWEDFLAERLPR
ncbi:MAG: SDR family oxidoreductase [Mycobacteriales bacterium]|jgi:uncharacterized protein YbjT (DUF2867 family)